MNIYLMFILALVALLALLVLTTRRAYQGFEDISSTKSILIRTFGTEIIWNDLYRDAYAMQDRYLTTLQKAVPEMNASNELERRVGAAPLKCTPAEIERTLARTPATSADARMYLNCLPEVDDFGRISEFLVNELQTSLTNSKNALAGVVVPVGIEGFAAAPGGISSCCDTTPIIALSTLANPRKMSATTRQQLRSLIDDGLAVIAEIDRMNTSAQDGTLEFTPPLLLS